VQRLKWLSENLATNFSVYQKNNIQNDLATSRDAGQSEQFMIKFNNQARKKREIPT